MAETLKFGNGEWATKEGSTLAYNDTNGNYKPLPFTFDRSTSATRVNKEGLIEVVSNNEPRIDFLNDSKGALLLEPSRSNLVTYSQDFSDTSWIKSNLTVNSVSENNPLGNKCYKIIGDNNNNLKLLYKNNILTSDTTFSVLVKASGYNFALIKGGGGAYRVVFDLVNGTVGNKDTDDGIYSIEDYGNGWYRCSAKFNNMPTNYASVTASATNSIFDKTGNGVDGILLAYTQAEIGSYATSYIPTQGSIGTRVAESCYQTPPSGIIGQTEGTLFLEYPNIDNLFAFIGLSIDGSNSNRMIIYSSGDNTLRAQFRQGGDIKLLGNSSVINGKVKAALSFSSTESVFYVNGIQVAVGTATIWSGLNGFLFNQANQIGAKVKELKLYNTRLSNSELQALTTI